ncbi:unnamed protein product, partial [Hydatigera taeniaeformis]|uniref:Major sperm protein n=1 Tax=Hydatigena taeniaeformis TaxID=6205 RepID=A0A0R3WVR0_HYDTA
MVEVVKFGREASEVDDTIAQSSVTSCELNDQEVEEEFGGPSLLFNGVLIPRLVRDKPNTYRIDTDPQFMLCFRSTNANPRHRKVVLKNNGTEDLIYQWKKVERTFFTEILPPRDSPFFFFSNNGGIARGESKTLHISFQSGYEGVFSETWKFTTNPPLCC